MYRPILTRQELEQSSMDADIILNVGRPTRQVKEEQDPRISFRQELLAILEEHVGAEEKSLKAYEDFSAGGDPVVAMLTGMLAKDEESHHGLLRSLVASFSESPYWKSRGEPLPAECYLEEGEATMLMATFAQFLAAEKAGQRQLKELAKRTKTEGRGLYSLLLETIAIDSQKQQHVLEYLIEYLTAGSKKAEPEPMYGGE